MQPVTTTPRSWVLNGYGRAEFAIPLNDPFCKERYIQYGNLIHIEHFPDENEDREVYGTLPAWSGIILPPRTWNSDAVLVTAYSAEAILAYRAMPYVSVTGTPGEVFRKIIDYSHASFANLAGGVPFFIKLGRIDDIPGMTYADELRTNAYDHIQKLIRFTGMDWEVRGRVLPESNALELTVSLYRRKPFSKNLVLTAENTEQANPLMTEQGTITNHVFAYNQAYTPADRTMQEVFFQDSIDKYGPFQSNQTFIGVTDTTSMLTDTARTRIAERGDVKKVVKRVALDYRDTFSNIDTGFIGHVHEPAVGFNSDGSLGFQSYVRIMSVSYNDQTNKADLNVEVMPGVDIVIDTR